MAAIDEEVEVVDARSKRGKLSAEISFLVPTALNQLLSPAAPHFNLWKEDEEKIISASAPSTEKIALW